MIHRLTEHGGRATATPDAEDAERTVGGTMRPDDPKGGRAMLRTGFQCKARVGHED
jgi:hypothetical protein